VEHVLAESGQAVLDFQAGKQQAIGALLREVRAATGGTANMKVARELLLRRLLR
jgi:Asp-tRNA(Asn)/Glu-tRNA(Gln) amidotransferase B subunit